MAYTDRAGKIITDAFAKFQVNLGSAGVVPGDLLSPQPGTDNWLLADETLSRGAAAVAIQSGGIGDTIWAALAANIMAPPTQTGGVWTAGTLAASTDIGSPLYLTTLGKASLSAGGTIVQPVGTVMAVGVIGLSPGAYLTGTTGALSGNLTVGGTEAVTGVATFTALPVFNAGVGISGSKGLVMTPNTLLGTGGSIMPGLNVITTGSAGSYTLPAYTAGTIVEVATAGAAGSVTIIGPSPSCFNSASAASRLVSQAAASEGIRLAAVSATRYAIIGSLTGWNPTN